MAAQLQPTASSRDERVGPALERTLRAEHGLARGIVVGVAVAVPVCAALWVGLIALALAGSSTSLVGPLTMGAGFGILTGVFFGTWWGFVSVTHTFEDLERNLDDSRPASDRPREPLGRERG
jgi:hypothetical protein